MSHVDMPGIAWPTIEEPLHVTPVSQVVSPGEFVYLGGGSYDLQLAGSETLIRKVTDGRLDTTGLPLGRYRLKATCGMQVQSAGTLVLVESR
jgi:hypothetical protein